MSVEGLWWFKTRNVAEGFNVSGVVVLETERIFGGDSAVAIIGSYAVAGNVVTGGAETFHYNPEEEVSNIFGATGSMFIEFQAKRAGDKLVGSVSPKGIPGVQSPLTLTFLRDLP